MNGLVSRLSAFVILSSRIIRNGASRSMIARSLMPWCLILAIRMTIKANAVLIAKGSDMCKNPFLDVIFLVFCTLSCTSGRNFQRPKVQISRSQVEKALTGIESNTMRVLKIQWMRCHRVCGATPESVSRKMKSTSIVCYCTDGTKIRVSRVYK